MSRSPAEQLALAPEADRAAFVESLTDGELAALLADWETFLARPEQIPPADHARWWALLTGRGFGKNRTASEWFVKRCEQFAAHRWPHTAALIGQTYDDVSAVQIHGESGIEAVCERRGHRLDHAGTSLHGKLRIKGKGHTHVTEIELHTAEKPDKVRGRNLHTAHADEMAAWTHKVDQAGGSAWSNLDFSLRAECPPGLQPMGCITTTPKPIPQIREITSGKLGGGVVITRGSLYDNVSNLAPEFVAAMAARYTGTRLAEQEIYGKVLDFVEGALWTPDLIQQHRVIVERGDYIPAFRRVVIGVDPSGSDGGDECGIVAVALSAEPVPTMLGTGLVVPMNHVYILRDASCRLRPALWVPRVVELYHELSADSVVAEVNFGAALVTDAIHMFDPMVKVREVRASRGKVVRAEPVAMVYDQGRAHHVGQVFPQLEEQMATWVSTDADSPDRMDALVWAVTELLPEITQPPSRDVSPAKIVASLPTGADAARRSGRAA